MIMAASASSQQWSFAGIHISSKPKERSTSQERSLALPLATEESKSSSALQQLPNTLHTSSTNSSASSSFQPFRELASTASQIHVSQHSPQPSQYYISEGLPLGVRSASQFASALGEWQPPLPPAFPKTQRTVCSSADDPLQPPNPAQNEIGEICEVRADGERVQSTHDEQATSLSSVTKSMPAPGWSLEVDNRKRRKEQSGSSVASRSRSASPYTPPSPRIQPHINIDNSSISPTHYAQSFSSSFYAPFTDLCQPFSLKRALVDRSSEDAKKRRRVTPNSTAFSQSLPFRLSTESHSRKASPDLDDQNRLHSMSSYSEQANVGSSGSTTYSHLYSSTPPTRFSSRSNFIPYVDILKLVKVKKLGPLRSRPPPRPPSLTKFTNVPNPDYEPYLRVGCRVEGTFEGSDVEEEDSDDDSMDENNEASGNSEDDDDDDGNEADDGHEGDEGENDVRAFEDTQDSDNAEDIPLLVPKKEEEDSLHYGAFSILSPRSRPMLASTFQRSTHHRSVSTSESSTPEPQPPIKSPPERSTSNFEYPVKASPSNASSLRQSSRAKTRALRPCDIPPPLAIREHVDRSRSPSSVSTDSNASLMQDPHRARWAALLSTPPLELGFISRKLRRGEKQGFQVSIGNALNRNLAMLVSEAPFGWRHSSCDSKDERSGSGAAARPWETIGINEGIIADPGLRRLITEDGEPIRLWGISDPIEAAIRLQSEEEEEMDSAEDEDEGENRNDAASEQTWESKEGQEPIQVSGDPEIGLYERLRDELIIFSSDEEYLSAPSTSASPSASISVSSPAQLQRSIVTSDDDSDHEDEEDLSRLRLDKGKGRVHSPRSDLEAPNLSNVDFDFDPASHPLDYGRDDDAEDADCSADEDECVTEIRKVSIHDRYAQKYRRRESLPKVQLEMHETSDDCDVVSEELDAPPPPQSKLFLPASNGDVFEGCSTDRDSEVEIALVSPLSPSFSLIYSNGPFSFESTAPRRGSGHDTHILQPEPAPKIA